MGLKSRLRPLTPPVLWELLRRMRGRPPQQSYQGVVSPFDMSALHQGRFADVFDQASRNDPGLQDGNEVRLRAYHAHLFAQLASRASGDYLAAGVSFGVIEKVVFELTVRGSGRIYHLIDPFINDETPGYSRDSTSIPALFGHDPSVKLHRQPIPDVLPIPLPGGLAFAHLTTGDEAAELTSLPYFIEQLSPGGVMLMDSYGLADFKCRYDETADRLGASIFSLVTGQGVLMKGPAICGSAPPR